MPYCINYGLYCKFFLSYFFSCVHQACTMGSEECVKLLLSYGVSCNIKDKTNLTPAMCAQINNHDSIVNTIEEHEKSSKG